MNKLKLRFYHAVLLFIYDWYSTRKEGHIQYLSEQRKADISELMKEIEDRVEE